ncbi:MAG: hypothetical protein ACK4UJ_06635 [Leptonema sp. (in: bacteria)]
MNILICGYGFTTQFLANNFDSFNYKILTQKEDIPEDLKFQQNSKFLPEIVIDSIPPIFKENEMINPIYKEILLDLYTKKKFVYTHISSTSVYPDENATYTEESEIPYFTEKGKLRWELEEKILNVFPYALIVRAGGIYGRERNLLLSLKKGNSQSLFRVNKIVYRIHVYDLCQILLKASIKIWDSGIETSIFRGYKRKNLILAIEPKNTYLQEVLEYLKANFQIEISKSLESTKTTRILKSLYSKDLIDFKYPDIFSFFNEFSE